MKYGFCQIVPEEKMQSWPTRSDLPSNLIPPQMPQTDVGNADELECSGISESAEDTTNAKSGPDTGQARCGPDESRDPKEEGRERAERKDPGQGLISPTGERGR